ncbi:MAG: ABC transporter ATP-binding protein [Deltaproteobacteria bacterium]|jgi:subfamily B ATP-binding cassette protein MsbA|nr:ABC transporter ATP-binding protein [Deltaproteobacteria bacterium]MBW2480211.1 ABC transporter ATP-binding protein [Deltaproteobacteria bacterium]
MKLFKSPQLTHRQKEMLSVIKDSWLRLLASAVCSAMVGAMTAATAYLVKPAVEQIFEQKNMHMLVLIPAAIIAVFAIKGLAAYGSGYLLSYVGQEVIRRLRNRLYNHIQDLPLAFFQRNKTGDLMSRITNDVAIVSAMFTSAITGSIRDGFSIIGLIAVTFFLIPKLAVFTFIVFPIAGYPLYYFGRKIRRVRLGVQEAWADINAFLHEAFTGTKIVKAFCMEEHEKKRFAQKSRGIFRLEMKENRVREMSSPLMELLGGLGIGFIIWYGGRQVIAGTYSFGAFMSFLTAVGLMYQPLKKISRLNNAIQRGMAAIERIYDILEQKSDLIETDTPVEIRPGSHRITFENVSFKYDRDLVLKNINLKAEVGEIIALVGVSGGGKTSLVNLIPRFYDPTEGRILLDEVDIRQVAIEALRARIAMVTQEPILFNDSIRNNIAYGMLTASEQQIEAAAKAAYAYDFIKGFPEGFNTSIGELGGRLSGGQRQRICIARALLKDAPILILDEATSSLDSESEILVQKALGNLMKGRTTFVIAHRLSTIGNADRIIVIVDGRIVEEGRHDDLLDRRQEYYKLYQMQFA